MPEPKFLNALTAIDSWRDKIFAGEPSSKEVVLRKEFISDIEIQPNRSIKFIITTGSPDREQDVIDPDGWDVAGFLKNPVVLFAHDYDSLPIAKATAIEQQGDKLIATAEFAPAELNPMAEQVFQMLKAGFLKGASVGFRPLDFNYNEERGGVDFVSQELLEFSIVPVPANAQALMAAGLKGADVEVMRSWAQKTLTAIEELALEKGIAPKDVSMVIAPMDTPWRRPNLGDFTEKPYEDLSQRAKRKIAGHYAWATAAIPEKFGDMKLPHHRPDDGYVVWRGVVAATGRLDQTDFPSEDMGAVKKHLAHHYEEFDRTAPWERDASSWSAFMKARNRVQAKSLDLLTDQQLARLLDDFGFEDEAVVLASSIQEEEKEAMPHTKQEPADEMESMARANKLIDKLRKDLNKIQDVARTCIVGIDEYQNSLRRSSEVLPKAEYEDDDEDDKDKDKAEISLIEKDLQTDTVLELLEDDDLNTVNVDMDNLADEIKSALTQTIGDSVRSEIRHSVNAMRGRID